MAPVELTILMPCLNEAETLAICIQKAKHFLATENIQGEILVADNGSADGSQTIAREQGARVISVATRGYGAALRSGIAAAQGEYIIMGDADNSYDFQHLSPFIAKLREGHDLVIGNRFKGGIIKNAMPWLNRYIGNPILSFLGRRFFKNNIGDFHCGLRGFKRESLQQLNLQGDGMEFASEMIAKATLKNLKLVEVPTPLFPDGRSRRPHLRPWRDGWRHLRLLFLLSPRWLFLYPGLSLLFPSLLCMLCIFICSLISHPLYNEIPLMLLSSIFMLTGLQAVSFSLFAKLIANHHLDINSSNKLLRLLNSISLER
ncbi:MAG: glycosyltransferase family 2 protein, partial [Gammaproteobacteria bacterium]|nr:glycosyltransferase family 2 protein [Gammaproteobacteria bacterium]